MIPCECELLRIVLASLIAATSGAALGGLVILATRR